MAKRSPRTTGGKPRRVPVSTKITPELRDQLEAAAQIGGRTLGNEIERRLERSLQIPSDFYRLLEDKATIRVLILISQSWNVVEALMDKPWYRDQDTLAAAKASASAIIGSLPPQEMLPEAEGIGLLNISPDLEQLGEKASEFITTRLTGGSFSSEFVPELKALVERTARGSGGTGPATHTTSEKKKASRG